MPAKRRHPVLTFLILICRPGSVCRPALDYEESVQLDWPDRILFDDQIMRGSAKSQPLEALGHLWLLRTVV